MKDQQFEWDDNKATKVLNKHNIDFEDMVQIFEGQQFIYQSDQNGEVRWTTVGILEEQFFAVIYTMRGDVIRLITARRARENEKREYYKSYPENSGQG